MIYSEGKLKEMSIKQFLTSDRFAWEMHQTNTHKQENYFKYHLDK
jgi:hypothetical protein